MARRAKIVATLGPASINQVPALVRAGLDVARFNMSHGSIGTHERAYDIVRRASDESGHSVGVLVDLQGPKIRVGKFAGGSNRLRKGSNFTICTDQVEGDEKHVGVSYSALPQDVSKGDRLLLDDGNLVLEVTGTTDTEVRCTVVVGGKISDHKGLNVPGAALSVPALSDKDADDLRWALRLRADMIALSFVRSAEDLQPVHRIMDEIGVRLPVLAKLEKPQAVDELDAVVNAFDGLMVARGDLGVELPLEEVPLVQKRAVELARERSKPVVVATQVLESMITSPRPTRAEASDAANAVLDGADALMLSAETSVGEYPVESVSMMSRIIAAAEEGLDRLPPLRTPPQTQGGAIATAAASVGAVVGAKFLVAFTQSGDTARRLARHRNPIPLLAFTPVPSVRSQLSLVWGVETFIVPEVKTTDEMVRQVDGALRGLGRCQPGDKIVVVAGSPPRTPGSTNALRVWTIGTAI
ncbi:MAG TPA: pyruvate kinase [Frankiaceae bacterium]|nr:pyruvate kinase [Frankiaceae bacterium]